MAPIFNKKIIIAMILALIVIFSVITISYIYFSDNAQLGVSDESNISSVETVSLANSTVGSVEVIKNIGYPNSPKRIAYVVGVHPLEHEVHETLVKILPNVTGLNYCYDIYIINVTQDVGYYGDGLSDFDSPGRQNGQNLAYEYVYPEIINGDYDLAIDVHSHVGSYPYQTLVFSPVKESLSVDYANEIVENCPDIVYYAPDTTTSGPYLTIPLNENGVPAFYFEEYSFASQDVKDAHVLELIHAVDNLKL